MSASSSSVGSNVGFLLRYWLPISLYCGLIYSLSAQPVWRLTLPSFFMADKLLHLTEYAILGVLACRAFGPGTRGLLNRREAILVTFLFSLAYGALDEVHQSFVPGRMLDFGDLVADVLGASVAGTAWWKLVWRPAGSAGPGEPVTP